MLIFFSSGAPISDIDEAPISPSISDIEEFDVIEEINAASTSTAGMYLWI